MNFAPATVHAVEALLLASPRPINEAELQAHLTGEHLDAILRELDTFWRGRGLAILRKDGSVAIGPSAEVLATFADLDKQKGRRLTEAAVQTLCYIAINQPVTQKNIESARGVVLFKGLIDSLMDAGFVRTSIRKTDSGRALTYVTTELFLEHFGLSALSDLPTQDELFELVGPLQASD